MKMPTKAASHSPVLIALKAESSAYIDELQAVSTMIDGPCNPKLYEIRFANKARVKLIRKNYSSQLYFLFNSAYPDNPEPFLIKPSPNITSSVSAKQQPIKTPVRVPRKVFGFMPASKIAS